MRNGTHHRRDLDLFSDACDAGARRLLVGNRDDRSRDGAVAGGGPLDGTSAVFDD